MFYTVQLAGMTLADAEKGDHLCIFLGAPCPSIIRSVGDGRWMLISGSCYVPTLMGVTISDSIFYGLSKEACTAACPPFPLEDFLLV